jgi:hypothetical protein
LRVVRAWIYSIRNSLVVYSKEGKKRVVTFLKTPPWFIRIGPDTETRYNIVTDGPLNGENNFWRVPLMWVGPYTTSVADVLVPEMKRSPVKVSHVASNSASAWEWTVKYGKAPLSSISQKGGIWRGQYARTGSFEAVRQKRNRTQDLSKTIQELEIERIINDIMLN